MQIGQSVVQSACSFLLQERTSTLESSHQDLDIEDLISCVQNLSIMMMMMMTQVMMMMMMMFR